MRDHLKAKREAIVSKRLAALSAQTFVEVAALPDVNSESIILDGKKLTLSVWHDVLESGEHRIVVQLYRHVILGLGWMQADGFAINLSNDRRTLTNDELYPFI